MLPAEGFFLGFTPIFPVFAINSLLIVGYLLADFFDTAGSTPYENNEIFDSILLTYKQLAVATNPKAQRAELGISLIAIGIYTMWVGLVCLL